MPTKRRWQEAGFPTQAALQQVYGRTLASALSCQHSGAGVWILVPLPSRARKKTKLRGKTLPGPRLPGT